MKRLFWFLAFSILLLLLGRLGQAVNAAPAAQQPYATPTAGPDGRILYIVQPGDNCSRIAELHGLTVEQLRALNGLDEACVLQPGQVLLIGIGGPALVSPTPGPSPTPESPTITPTPLSGTTEICVLVYEDANGDALRQETEPAVAGSIISLIDVNGMYSQNQPMPPGSEPLCFADVPASTYKVSIGLPDNYNPTTQLTYEFSLQAGERIMLGFGAQKKIASATTTAGKTPSDTTTPWLGLIGGLLLLGGLALAWYSWRLDRARRRARRLR